MIQDVAEGGGKKPYTNRGNFAWGRAYAYFFSTFAHFLPYYVYFFTYLTLFVRFFCGFA
jgi:hypothetical protein